MTYSPDLEQDALLPGGQWEGFYSYHGNTQKHKMDMELNFSNLSISGSGVDDVGTFIWEGKYDLTEYKSKLVNQYQTHKVHYNGSIDENGIWGIWELFMDFYTLSGGFHIWPKKQYQDIESISTKEETSIIITEYLSISNDK
jgi:hypothetical protein